jgi:hypothetical protein
MARKTVDRGRRAGRALNIAFACIASFGASGCLSQMYRIERSEIERMARLPPAQRAQRVRVEQALGSDDFNQSFTPMSDADAEFYRGGVFPSTAPVFSRRSGSSGLGGGSDPLGPFAIPEVVALAAWPPSQVALAGAGIVATAAWAGFESSRAEGWTSLRPDTVIYVRPEGRQAYVAVPLASLTRNEAEFGADALVNMSEGVRWLGDAPLVRRGFAIDAELGASSLPRFALANPVAGIAGRVGMLGFPSPYVGIGAALDVAGAGPPVRLSGRIGPEIRVFPVHVVGLYAGGGLASVQFFDTFFGWFARAGVLVEIPVRPRVALQVRGGATLTDMFEGTGPQWGWESGVGIAVY